MHTPPKTSHSSNDMRLANARLLPSLTTILEVTIQHHKRRGSLCSTPPMTSHNSNDKSILIGYFYWGNLRP